MFYAEQVETLLKNNQGSKDNNTFQGHDSTSARFPNVPDTTPQAMSNLYGNLDSNIDDNIDVDLEIIDNTSIIFPRVILPVPNPLSLEGPANSSSNSNASKTYLSESVLNLKLDEPLPPQGNMDDL